MPWSPSRATATRSSSPLFEHIARLPGRASTGGTSRGLVRASECVRAPRWAAERELPQQASSPTGASSMTGARRTRRPVRVRHGAHISKPLEGQSRAAGSKPPDACASLRQSPAPPQIISTPKHPAHSRRRCSPLRREGPTTREKQTYRQG
jgi:hypothetical protein